MLLDKPLSQDEIDELDGFLTSDAVSEGCMDISMLHGFVTAVAIGPSAVLPSEWLPVVWADDEGPFFESSDEAQRVFRLILRLHNDVFFTLQEVPHKFLPILYEEKDEKGELKLNPEGWCEGFLRRGAVKSE